jgi:Beta-glucan synthesis-associated protein SKN1/KRE6/Sbg1
MVSSWNKVCFTTGYIETSISLPGNAVTSGLWPGPLPPSMSSANSISNGVAL